MPGFDYLKCADRKEQRLFDDPNVGEADKSHVKRFLLDYDVTHARRSIFLQWIRELLLKVTDFKTDMHCAETIMVIYRSWRNKYSPATYGTTINVGKMYARWLNDGKLPLGFQKLKQIPRCKWKRDLRPEDMITWKNGLDLAKLDPSIQVQAILLTQLDGGFRPREFASLKYGDVRVNQHTVVIHVRNGKMGKQRFVVLCLSVPIFLRWYYAHPTKRKDDWLWVNENPNLSHPVEPKACKGHSTVLPYEIGAMSERMRGLREKISFDKPLDFYNLRHSAAVLMKKDNVPVDVAAARMGHSVKYYVEVYGRLCADDEVARYESHYGLSKKASEKPKNKNCLRCKYINESISEFCYNCSAPLTLKTAIENDCGGEERGISGQKSGLSDQQIQKIREHAIRIAIKEIDEQLKGIA